MNRLSALLVLATSVLVFAGCGGSGIRVQHDWDETADFAAFETFAILATGEVGDPLVERRIADAIRVHLRERGFTEDEADPDFLVAVHTNVENRTDVHTWGYSASSRHWHGGRHGHGDITVVQYQEGTLIIDFVAKKDMELFWRGWGSGRLRSSSREAVEIQDAVDRILRQYPPK